MSPSSAAGGGYSATPLVKKLGVKAGHRLHIAHRPSGWDVPGLPEDCEVTDGGTAAATAAGGHGAGHAKRAARATRATRSAVDVTLAFYRTLGDASSEAPGLVEELADTAMLWIAWPRRAAGHDSDITENALRELFLPLGVVDVKVAALGEDWSGLKFVRRRENRSPAAVRGGVR